MPARRPRLLRMLGLAGRGTPQVDDAALLGAALTAVAARLRAGQTPHAAWAASLEGLPGRIAQGLEAVGADAMMCSAHPRGGRAEHPPPGRQIAGALRAAQAATQLAEDLGTELAPVLHACAEGIEESARASADRVAAFAGPRATARLLLALPIASLIIGSLIGARPLELFTSSAWGAALAGAAGALLLAGRWWIRRLLHRAETAAET